MPLIGSLPLNPGLWLISALGLVLIVLAIVARPAGPHTLMLGVAGLVTMLLPLSEWAITRIGGFAVIVVMVSGLMALIAAPRMLVPARIVAIAAGLALVTMPFWFVPLFFVT